MKLAFVLGLLALVVGVFTSAIPGVANADVDFCKDTCDVLYRICTGMHCGSGHGWEVSPECHHQCVTEACIYGGGDNDCASKCGNANEECGSKFVTNITDVASLISSTRTHGNETATTRHHSTDVVTRLPPGRHEEEATTTRGFTIIGGPSHLIPNANKTTAVSSTRRFTTIGGPSHLAPNINTTATVSYMNIMTRRPWNNAPPARREEKATSTGIMTIGGPSHLTFVPHTTGKATSTGIRTIGGLSHLSFVPHHTTHRPTNIETDRRRQAERKVTATTTSTCATPTNDPHHYNLIEQPPTVSRSAKCMNTCDQYYNACLTSRKCKGCPGKYSNGPDFASPCSETCIVDTCNRQFPGKSKYMCNVECGYESLKCGGPIVSLFKPTIVNPDPTAKAKIARGERDVGTVGPPFRGPPIFPETATSTTHVGAQFRGPPIQTETATSTAHTCPAPTIPTATGSLGTVPGHPRDIVTGPATTTHLTRPRIPLIGTAPTLLTTLITRPSLATITTLSGTHWSPPRPFVLIASQSSVTRVS